MIAASAQKFDQARAGEYEAQSRIALAGYEACHDLAACVLSAALGRGGVRRLLVVGIGGTGAEVAAVSRLEPEWRFAGVDPSEPMLHLARERLTAQGLIGRVNLHAGDLESLPPGDPFDAAMMLGVLHHVPGDAAKIALLKAIAARLPAGAPLILAGNRFAYAERPLLLKAWGERWRMHGASDDEVKAKLGKILQGADPPHSEAAIFDLLAEAGFERPEGFFSSLFWGAWIAFRG